ncbi:LysR family transcriptional regulator [Hahella ganghwensis]|uniref:LysR family transcriptional regulator n=1 Tax=Hahella ganghwensis TaxID=286420 RepID=UPI0003625997|nr:LysR family transcriptional regulator [Hahella ganghwensis]
MNFIDIRKIDYNLAVVFLAIWKERSVSKAADKLALSQSATSAALTRLRDLCQDPLFIRIRGGMEPTSRAESIQPALEQSITLLHQSMTLAIEFDPKQSDRQFFIGMSDDFELALAPALSKFVAQQAPGISLIYSQTNRHRVEQMLESGQIELAVIAGEMSRPWIDETLLGESGYSCVFNRRKWRIQAPLDLEEFLRLPHIRVSYSGTSGEVDIHLKALERSRHVHTSLTHFSSLPHFLNEIPSISTIPDHAARVLCKNSDLEQCPVPFDMGRYSVRVLRRKTQRADPGLNWLIRLLCSCGL